jgi:hypothetical protein
VKNGRKEKLRDFYMELKYTYSNTIEAKKFYDNIPELLKALNEKYEIIGFRPPLVGELFAAAYGVPIGKIESTTYNYENSNPRLILKPRVKVVSGSVSHTQMFTVKEIYGKDEVKIPEGWRYVGFDIPDDRQYYLTDFNAAPTRGSLRTPRIIVERCS